MRYLVDVLTLQRESRLESEKGRKKKDSDAISELEDRISRHRFHVEKLELILRKLENEDLTAEDLSLIRDGVEDYIERNEEADFLEDEELYDALPIPVNLSSSSVTIPKPEPAPSDTVIIQPVHLAPKKEPPPKVELKEPAAAAPPSPVKPKTEAKTPAATKTPAQPKKIAEPPRQTPTPPPAQPEPKVTPAPVPTSTPAPQPQAARPARVAEPTPAPAPAVMPKTASPAPAAPEARPAPAPAPVPVPAAETVKTPPVPAVAEVRTAPVAVADKEQPALATSGGGVQRTEPRFEVLSRSADARVADRRQGGTQQLPTARQEIRRELQTPVTGSVLKESAEQVLPEVGPISKTSLTSNMSSQEEHEWSLQMLESSLQHIPQEIDSERPKQYPKPARHPCNTPAYYPQQTLPTFDNPQTVDKFDTDTLFFIFYYQQGTYQQYLAARELKKQSWRYHKKYLTWFQRHEEPKEITNDYEQGTYVYFDYETGWCQRKKSEFTFEYRYLEDYE